MFEYTDTFGVIRNGSSFESGGMPLGAHESLEVPEEAIVRQGGPAEQVRVYLQKRLAFGGHPPWPVTIDRGATLMGVAWYSRGPTLYLATYGEWDSHIEGSASIRLLVEVPDAVSVATRPGLSGGDSVAHRGVARACRWYGPGGCASGWTPLATGSDPEKTALSGRTPFEEAGYRVGELPAETVRPIGGGFWALKRLLDQDHCFGRSGSSPQLLQCLDRLLALMEPHPCLQAAVRAGRQARICLQRNEPEAGYAFMQTWSTLFPHCQDTDDFAEYIQATVDQLKAVSDRAVQSLSATESSLGQMLAVAVEMKRWGRNYLSLDGPPKLQGGPFSLGEVFADGVDPFTGESVSDWKVNLELKTSRVEATLTGRLPEAPGELSVEVDTQRPSTPPRLQVDGRPQEIGEVALQVRIDAHRFAHGQFAFRVAKGRLVRGTFTHLPVLEFRVGMAESAPTRELAPPEVHFLPEAT